MPHTGVAERLLVRLGVRDHTARLLAATPALRGSSLPAIAATLVFAVLAAQVGSGPDASLAFLTVAPLLPLAGIAMAYRPGIDPNYEIGLAAPMRSLRLLLRAAAVVRASAVLAAASLALPGLGLTTASCLLSALALASHGPGLSTCQQVVSNDPTRGLLPAARAGGRRAGGPPWWPRPTPPAT